MWQWLKTGTKLSKVKHSDIQYVKYSLQSSSCKRGNIVKFWVTFHRLNIHRMLQLLHSISSSSRNNNNNNNNNNKSVGKSKVGKVTILWNQQIQTDRTIPNNKPDIIIRYNEKGTCILIDVTISGDRNVIKKEAEKILKYKDLTIEI